MKSNGEAKSTIHAPSIISCAVLCFLLCHFSHVLYGQNKTGNCPDIVLYILASYTYMKVVVNCGKIEINQVDLGVFCSLELFLFVENGEEIFHEEVALVCACVIMYLFYYNDERLQQGDVK